MHKYECVEDFKTIVIFVLKDFSFLLMSACRDKEMCNRYFILLDQRESQFPYHETVNLQRFDASNSSKFNSKFNRD